MTDTRTIKDFLSSSIGQKMMQEAAEETIRDFDEQKALLLAKTIAVQLPTGKFGEELKKVAGFNFQTFSEVLADLDKGWINSLPIDRDTKVMLGQIVDGVIRSGKR